MLSLADPSSVPGLLAAEPLTLLAWWKAVVVLLVFLGWAWVVSAVFDKDAARFYLKRQQWNIMHAAMGALAVLAAVLSPSFFIGLPVMIVLLAIDLFVYFSKRNADPRVGEANRWSLNPSAWAASAGKGKKEKKGKVDKAIRLTIRGPKGVLEAPAPETPEFALRVKAEEVIIAAMDKRGSRFDIAPGPDGKSYASSYLVDGVRGNAVSLTPTDAVAIVDFWKSAAGLDVQDRRRRQQADLNFDRTNVKYKVRLTTMGSQGGMSLSGLFDPEKQTQRKVEELGLFPPQQEALEAIIKDEHGAVMLAAPGGQGRTSLMYAVLRRHDAYTNNVQTLETEVQGSMEGVRQNVFNPLEDGAEYATTARSLLRRDPDVLALADMPDAQTAQEVARADLGRTRVYLGIKADGALMAIQMYVKAVGDADKAAKGLHGAVAGKLLRKLCPNCKQAYAASPDMLKKLGLPGDKAVQLFKKGGQVLVKNKPEECPMCQGGGYLLQEGCFEVFPLGDEERKMVAAQDWAALRASFRKNRLMSIQESALRKALDGTTSVEEVIRITAAQAPAPPAAAPGQRPAGAPAPAAAQPSAPKPAAAKPPAPAAPKPAKPG